MSKLLLLLLFSTTVCAGTRDLTFSTKCGKEADNAILSFLGDILIHKPLYLSVIKGSQHFNQIWKKTEGLLNKADFSVANLEGPAAIGIDRAGHDHGDIGFVYDDQVYSGTNLVFNYHPRVLSDLLVSGIDLITSANNHVMDRLSIGIDKTIIAARLAGIPTVGTRKSDEANGEFYKIVTVKNMHIAFIGCTEVTNDPDLKNQVLMCEGKEIFNIIKIVSARSDVDALVVLPHWGVEYSNEPKDYQREYAHRYIEAGALAVVGSHPHVLQPWEKYIDGKGREALIIYSLGNFVAEQAGLERQTGAITYMGITKKIGQKAHIFGNAYTPTYRVDQEILPVSKSNFPEALAHAESMYGVKARVEPLDELKNVICSIP
jgi:hypothetical protein